ncbi:MAG: DUF4194 domain-containing protein [Cellulomonadaceae bacterium]
MRRTADEHAIAVTIIRLMRGVVYREIDEDTWTVLSRQNAAVRDHFATIGVDVVLDDIEGYAYLRSQEESDDEEPLPRLVRRRSLSYNLSLLLVLLRKRLAEFETSGTEGTLVLTREQIVDALRVFLTGSTNEARAVDTVDTTIRKAVELSFLRGAGPPTGHPGRGTGARGLRCHRSRHRRSGHRRTGGAPPLGGAVTGKHPWWCRARPAPEPSPHDATNSHCASA